MARANRKAKGTGANSVVNAKKRINDLERDDDGRWLSLYRPEYCEAVIKGGSLGLSETQLAVEVCDVARFAMRTWAKKYPDFRIALARAKDEAMAYWERQARKGLRDRNFNSHLWTKVVSSRFRDTYSERMTVEGDEEKPLVHKIVRTIVDPRDARHSRNSNS